jgi:hypothetical protein
MADVSIDGILVNLSHLLESLKLQGNTREQLAQDREARSKKFGIKVQPGAPLTMPARFLRAGATLDDLADRVNLRYLIWLSKPDRESLTRSQLAQVRNAKARFSQFSNRYDSASRTVVERRIDEARKKFAVGEFTEKHWQCDIAKEDEERQIVYGVALRPDKPDLQGDIMTKEQIEIAAHKFMADSRKGDLHHKQELSGSDFIVIESAIARVDEPPNIKKGDWVVGVKLSDSLWQMVKDKEINAFSIRGFGKRRQIN